MYRIACIKKNKQIEVKITDNGMFAVSKICRLLNLNIVFLHLDVYTMNRYQRDNLWHVLCRWSSDILYLVTFVFNISHYQNIHLSTSCGELNFNLN